MTTPNNSQNGDSLYLKQLRQSVKDCQNYQKFCAIAFCISVLLIAVMPIVGGLLVVGSWLVHKHFADAESDYKKQGRDFLISKGIDPDDWLTLGNWK